LLRPNLLFALGADIANGVEPQPYFAGVNRAIQTLANLGVPLTARDAAQIAALSRQNNRPAVGSAERILSRYTIARLTIEPGGSLHIAEGECPRILVE